MINSSTDKQHLEVSFVDCRLQTSDASYTTNDSYEKTKRGPPTNKNISVRNIKAQIANMTISENAGFKSEYHVRISIFKSYFIFKIQMYTNCKIQLFRISHGYFGLDPESTPATQPLMLISGPRIAQLFDVVYIIYLKPKIILKSNSNV